MYQASGVGVDAVGRVGKLCAVFGILWKLFIVVKPTVLRSGKALIFQTSQLC